MVAAADDAIMLKRCVKAAATRSGQRATFMAKPFAEESGSGLHVHLSLVDAAGRNVFGETEDGRRLLAHAIGGLRSTMCRGDADPRPPTPTATAACARAHYAPISPTWGVNNRNRRLAHPRRVPPAPGASSTASPVRTPTPTSSSPACWPASCTASSTASTPGPETTGSAYDQPAEPALPLTWDAAITAFKAGGPLRGYLGEKLCDLYAACREGEAGQVPGGHHADGVCVVSGGSFERIVSRSSPLFDVRCLMWINQSELSILPQSI